MTGLEPMSFCLSDLKKAAVAKWQWSSVTQFSVSAGLVPTYKIYKICQFVGLKKKEVTTIVCVFLRKAPTKNEDLGTVQFGVSSSKKPKSALNKDHCQLSRLLSWIPQRRRVGHALMVSVPGLFDLVWQQRPNCCEVQPNAELIERYLDVCRKQMISDHPKADLWTQEINPRPTGSCHPPANPRFLQKTVTFKKNHLKLWLNWCSIQSKAFEIRWYNVLIIIRGKFEPKNSFLSEFFLAFVQLKIKSTTFGMLYCNPKKSENSICLLSQKVQKIHLIGFSIISRVSFWRKNR